jgi:transcriptional repressor NrdR
MPLFVIKKDGSRQVFDKQKLINGMIRACAKRPVPLSRIEEVADYVEQILQNSLEKEVSTQVIGEMITKKLKEIDEVAYIRFASVYRSFEDIDSFLSELNTMRSGK